MIEFSATAVEYATLVEEPGAVTTLNTFICRLRPLLAIVSSAFRALIITYVNHAFCIAPISIHTIILLNHFTARRNQHPNGIAHSTLVCSVVIFNSVLMESRHVHKSTSFREGFRHRSSFVEDEDQTSATSETTSPSGEEKEINESLRRKKDEIRQKGTESFQRTGLGESWKESVEDIFRMFSKSPDSRDGKRKRAVEPDDSPSAASPLMEDHHGQGFTSSEKRPKHEEPRPK